jgi:general secretion pathway protein C
MKRISLILSVVLFIALCVTGSFWVMQLMKPEPRKISAPPVQKPIADVESVAGLFGGAMATNTNYQLKGIILANPGSQSGAIIVVDGKPAQAFRINGEINPGVKLGEVHAGYILILDNGISKRLDLPQDAGSSGQAGIGANSGYNARISTPGLVTPPPSVNNNRHRAINPGNPLADGNARMPTMRPSGAPPDNPNPNDPANNPANRNNEVPGQ